MTDDPLDYRPTSEQAVESLMAKTQELIERRDLIELFDTRGLPKPMVPVGGGMWARSPIAVLHGLGFKQARDPVHWRAYLRTRFPVRDQILVYRLTERRQTLGRALATNLLSVRQTKAATLEIEDLGVQLHELEQLRKAA